ncbi:MAG TPA: ribosome assembly cofactor RimP, partial [Chitinophagaceae bacterium]|nr:ribosome assembly cofactor RimP [Chitinophagaceae bacterium]
MIAETLINTVTPLVQEQLESDPAYYLVDLRVKPTNNIKIFIDGDNGITIEKCIAVNRALYKKIEELGLFPEGDFSLEVSSPGVGEPLKMFRQYRKNIGRKVEVILKDDQKIEGKLAEVRENEIAVEETKGKGKKQEVII